MVRYLKHFTNNVSYIYHQRSEGHGISNQIVPQDTNLLIIVDSSTNETEECQKLSDQGIDIIILDHHPKSKNNIYATIVNPQLDNYPNKELSGVGVVFKTCEVLDDLLNENYSSNYLDLVGIGIYADVMSMREPENRYFVFNALNNITNLGIKAILYKQNVYSKNINSQTIGFQIAPVINASARMEKIEKIIELFLEDDYNICLELAKECIKLNTDRKNKEAKYFKKMKEKVDNSHKIIILITEEKDKIDKGFQGLLATKIVDYYKKPCLVVKNTDGICAGSGRGINGLNFKFLLQQTDLFSLLEGHNNAFGCEFKYDDLEDIIKFVNGKLVKKSTETVIQYDIEIDAKDINYQTVKKIQEFNYLAGKGAETTRFLIRNLPILERNVIGKIFDTIKLKSNSLDLMKFRVNEWYADELKEGELIDVVGSLGINRWYHWGEKREVTSLQCIIEDYKLSKVN